MTAERMRLEELRDQALRDLVELDRQIADGEIPPDAAAGLRRRYEATAARTLAALDATAQAPSTGTPTRRRPSRARVVAYALTALAAVVAAAVLLPQYLAQRPVGGFVTGNEVSQGMRQDPGTAEARAQVGWLLLKSGQPTEALRSVEAALRVDPTLLDAQWFKANIELYGLNEPAAALATLDRIRGRTDVPASVLAQVDDLAAIARARLPENRR